MLTLRESLLDNTNTKIGRVKSQLNSLGYKFVISDCDMWMSLLSKFGSYIDTNRLADLTKDMHVISDNLIKMLNIGYAGRMKRVQPDWDSVVNIWTFIDNFEWSTTKVNYDTCQTLVSDMNRVLREAGVFKKNVEFYVWSQEKQGSVKIVLRRTFDHDDKGYADVLDNMLEFTIRKKR